MSKYYLMRTVIVMAKTIDEQIENTEIRLKRLKKIKAERKLRAELRDVKSENTELKRKILMYGKDLQRLHTYQVSFENNTVGMLKRAEVFDNYETMFQVGNTKK